MKYLLRLCITCTFLCCLTPALLAQQRYRIESTSGSTLLGEFDFSGSLPSDGTYNFATNGNPLSNTSIATGGILGTFTMPTSLTDGLFNFSTTGSPLTSPNFNWSTDSANNQPNQNDQYQVSGGLVTALKYDLFGNSTSESMNLSLGNTYAISDGFSTIGSGTYTVQHQGGGDYSVLSISNTFTNQPNQNDTYTILGGALTALKYDLFSGGDTLFLSDDGSFELRDSGFSVIGSGTYGITAIPEPSTFAFLGMGIAGWIIYRRRLRARKSIG